MIDGSKAIYRWQQAIPPKMAMLRNVLVLINFLYTVVVLNYSSVGFMVLSLHETLVAFKSVYYIGTVIPIAVLLLSYLVPVKPVRPKTRKEE
jgi:lysophospholipid acyltransferase